MVEKTLRELEAALGYSFGEKELLAQALTHSSRKSDLRRSNERLEFLGDAILGAVISEYLYRAYPDYAEGDLTRLKSAVVSRTALARVAKDMSLGRYLIVAKGVARLPEGERDGDDAEFPTEPGQEKRVPQSLLADAVEAIIAAVYLDGGSEAARSFVLRHLTPAIERADSNAHGDNFKSALQQYTQREKGCVPMYELTAEDGPDHGKSFEVATLIAGQRYGRGRGRTKKAAEQEAARRTLEMLGVEL